MISRPGNFISIPATIFLLVVLFACQGDRGSREGRTPNFVFILVDDLGWTDLGCFGSSFYETPNIDRLAGGGTKFTNAYAACPVCSPTRASILTGKYPARMGLTDWIPGRQAYAGPQPCDKLIPEDFDLEMKLEEITVAEALKANGYRTFFAGKWHLGQDSVYWPEYQGFDINVGGWSVGSPRGGYFSPYENPRLASGPEGEHLADRITSESIRFLESAGSDPFFLYLSFYSVHTPLQAKDELIEKYSKKARDLGLTNTPQLAAEMDWIRTAPPAGNFVERIVQGHPVYAGMIETLDVNVGRLMKKLGLATAEGSPTSNLPLRAGKGWLYEGGIREAMIVKWPGRTEAGSSCDVPVTSTDFYPTIMEMAGLDQIPEQHMDGVSMVPLFDMNHEPEDRPIFWHYPHYSNQGGKPGAAVRKGKYKLIEFFEDKRSELYDLDTDPGEAHDLTAEMPEKAEELLQLLHSWQENLGARMMHPNPGYNSDYSRK